LPGRFAPAPALAVELEFESLPQALTPRAMTTALMAT
jgi:hypothetical protein